MTSPAQFATGENVMLVGSGVTLAVVSNDQRLVVLCREVLRELGDTECEVEVRAGTELAPSTQVCLWDCESAGLIPGGSEFENSRVLYLVSPAQVESLLRSAPAAEGHVLLKPVTRAVLRAFLASAVPFASASPSVDNSSSAEVGTLRANRDELLQRLLHANLRLQEYDQQRTNFIARAVHDFRAPLTALSGFCGLLASGELGPLDERQKEALERMQHSTKRISRMAAAMFDLSIGAKVNPRPNLREGDIRERIKQAVYEVLPLAREKQISVQAENVVAPGSPLYFEASQIEQVLLNLLDNACKFTHRGGTIEVSGYPYFWERRFLLRGSSAPAERRLNRVSAPNSYRIDIEDTGPGVPPERLNHIFEEYTSYAGPQDRSGGGLGLAICRLIMSRHEGHIWADSHQRGAVFSFVLPYRRTESQGNVPSSASP
jgi:signal transduction histidine kinase